MGVRLSAPDEVEPQVIRHFEQQEVISAMERLAPKDQEVIRLAYWEDLPHAQIGDLLGCSAGAVDVRLHRAVRRLEKGLGAAGHRRSGGVVLSPGDEQP
jgi:RNA polymerase sigma-70 factor (ECF subfamily)